MVFLVYLLVGAADLVSTHPVVGVELAVLVVAASSVQLPGKLVGMHSILLEVQVL